MHLTLEQEALYWRLTMHYMETAAPLPNNTVALSRIAGVSHDKFLENSEAILIFYRKSGEKLHHKHCDGILANQRERKKSYSERKLGKKKSLINKNLNENKAKKSTENQKYISTSATVHNNTEERVLLEKEPKEKIKKPLAEKPSEVSQAVWDDFIRQRKTKFTKTALDGIEREVAKAGIALEAGLRTAVERGWQSFKVDWIENSKGTKNETNRENNGKYKSRSERADEAHAEFLAEYGAAGVGSPNIHAGSPELRHLPDLREGPGGVEKHHAGVHGSPEKQKA